MYVQMYMILNPAATVQQNLDENKLYYITYIQSFIGSVCITMYIGIKI